MTHLPEISRRGLLATGLGLLAEIPLILADRRFHDAGSLNYRTLTLIPQGHWDGGDLNEQSFDRRRCAPRPS